MRRLIPATALAALLALCGPARAEPCDMALVLAMDVSGSVTTRGYEMQRDGAAEAFNDRQVINAIASGPHKRIAIAITHWSTSADVVMPWRIITVAALPRLIADMHALPRLSSGSTDLAYGMIHAVQLMQQAPCEADRRVVDISGDGKHNAGLPTMAEAHAAAEAADIEINGLAIVNDEADVVEWYRTNVRSPTGFVIEANGFEEFGSAMRAKLSLEIALARGIVR